MAVVKDVNRIYAKIKLVELVIIPIEAWLSQLLTLYCQERNTFWKLEQLLDLFFPLPVQDLPSFQGSHIVELWGWLKHFYWLESSGPKKFTGRYFFLWDFCFKVLLYLFTLHNVNIVNHKIKIRSWEILRVDFVAKYPPHTIFLFIFFIPI